MLSRRLLRIKAVKALYSHFKSESDSLIVSEKNLMLSIDKTYELYLQMLWLVVEVANYAENRIELGRRKHLPTPEELNPNTKFVDNRVVAALRESNALTDYLQRKKLGWVQAPELVKKLYHAMVESDYYRKYMDAPARSFKEDVRLVESFYTRTVGESEALEEALEEQSILWADDADFAVIMVLRTLDDMRASQTDVPLLPQYKSEDDAVFVNVDVFKAEGFQLIDEDVRQIVLAHGAGDGGAVRVGGGVDRNIFEQTFVSAHENRSPL